MFKSGITIFKRLTKLIENTVRGRFGQSDGHPDDRQEKHRPRNRNTFKNVREAAEARIRALYPLKYDA